LFERSLPCLKKFDSFVLRWLLV